MLRRLREWLYRRRERKLYDRAVTSDSGGKSAPLSQQILVGYDEINKKRRAKTKRARRQFGRIIGGLADNLIFVVPLILAALVVISLAPALTNPKGNYTYYEFTGKVVHVSYGAGGYDKRALTTVKFEDGTTFAFVDIKSFKIGATYLVKYRITYDYYWLEEAEEVG
jgi:hypothetical protein